MRQVFRLCWTDKSDEDSYFFLSPDGETEDSFRCLCDSLIPIAARTAVELEGRTNSAFVDVNAEPTWVGWHNIVQVMANRLLPPRGYELVILPTATYVGGMIIEADDREDSQSFPLDAATLAVVDGHNKKVERRLNEVMKAVREELRLRCNL